MTAEAAAAAADIDDSIVQTLMLAFHRNKQNIELLSAGSDWWDGTLIEYHSGISIH